MEQVVVPFVPANLQVTMQFASQQQPMTSLSWKSAGSDSRRWAYLELAEREQLWMR
jgi:hypothetical protein